VHESFVIIADLVPRPDNSKKYAMASRKRVSAQAKKA
jgi:hypothetical protein